MLTEVLKSTPESLEILKNHFSAGEIAAIPTETVYGLGANAFNESAVLKVFEIKKRPHFDPLIVHTSFHSLDELGHHNIIDLDLISPSSQKIIHQLIERFWPGPLTIILPKGHRIPDLVTSGLTTVAVRSPAKAITRELLRKLPFPLAAPSANRFGKISPTSAEDVVSEFKGQVRYVLDGGSCEHGIESTVVQPSPDGSIHLLRPGMISVEDLSSIVKIQAPSTQKPSQILSPGNLDSHYAPSKPFYLLPFSIEQLQKKHWKLIGEQMDESTHSIGLFCFTGDPHQKKSDFEKHTGKSVTLELLDPEGDPKKMCGRFFSSLRSLEKSSSSILFAEPLEGEQGLKLALKDRIKRATQPI